MPPAPDIPLDERYRIGNEKRLRGNRWYSRGDHSMAVQCYRKAVEYLDDESIESEIEVININGLCCIFPFCKIWIKKKWISPRVDRLNEFFAFSSNFSH